MRIVGIGASAGGLSAFEEFFRHTQPDTGMAFIIVQHLDPTQKALLPELLRKFTAMPVCEARQNMPVEPNTLYVIPPNKDLSVSGNMLKLAAPAEPRGMRLPINVLFSSLASAFNERAIAIVLSGMGSDGTLGLQAIRATGGLTAVQQPDTAQFDAMPKSAIASGCADIVAPPSMLPERILAFTSRVNEPGPDSPPPAPSEPIGSILRLLQKNTHHDFSLYKRSTLSRRIERRMAIHGIGSISAYAQYLGKNSQEVELLFRELLIGVTEFFRDPDIWEYLAETALPDLLATKPSDQKVRAWVVGCSTGEEAYSLAMVFTEVLERLRPGQDINLQIFASDLSAEAIVTARRGQYPFSISEHVSEQRLARFFTKHGSYYQVNPALRDTILFAQHDVILDPPFTKLDLIACRNLLIYFDTMLQRRLLPLFHYSLSDRGLLMLGNSETVGRLNYLFARLKPRLRLYQRLDHESIRGPNFLLRSFPPLSELSKEQSVPVPTVPPNTPDNLQDAADHLLLQVYAPAAVVLNRDADIVYISGRTGKYLEPAAGKANWNIHAMAREGLRVPLFTALKQAVCQLEPVELHSLEVQTGVGIKHVDVTVQALHEPAVLEDMIIVVFKDTDAGTRARSHKPASTAAHKPDERWYQQEIKRLGERERESREELQTSNEELQSTNEELQSANEELTTSKEEMQSMNEELQTINTELQTKLDDLALAQSDMQNVLNSIEIAIIFLDSSLNIRRYTARASDVFSLRESDVGRPLRELSTVLRYPDLETDANETLKTVRTSERQIQTTDRRWFSVRIMPYRRLDNEVDGLVMTMVDITDTKTVESSLREESAGKDGAHPE
ncbi:PAS domain-containing protein [Marinobacter sediminum]|uniref:chemotaxis protein CheB n=1 Tax=Marinobacter sediminum TaxID=256323 RepID=UPI00202E21D3|nr:chemotaxis protein CheB [Marinobacter sediminum]MCM0613148.1 PAS domain-containing protein [Marinobacter sediminum]